MTDDDPLAAVTKERDALQARIDAYEGDLQEWEHMRELIAESSLGTPAAETLRNQTPPGVGVAIALGSQYLARAEAAETEVDRLRAKLHELMVRNADHVDLMNAQYGCPDCGVHHACGEIVAERDHERGLRQGLDRLGNTLFEERDEARAERDRLRAVVERAHDHVGTDEHILRSLATDDLVALVGVLRQDCRDAVIENDRLRAVVDGYIDDLSHIAFAVAGHRTGAMHHDDILGLVQSAVAERDRLRAVVDAARAINAKFQADAGSRHTGLPVLIDRLTLLGLSMALGQLDGSAEATDG